MNFLSLFRSWTCCKTLISHHPVQHMSSMTLWNNYTINHWTKCNNVTLFVTFHIDFLSYRKKKQLIEWEKRWNKSGSLSSQKKLVAAKLNCQVKFFVFLFFSFRFQRLKESLVLSILSQVEMTFWHVQKK